MNDQELLRDLARAALEKEEAERGRWERWDRLNDGDLSAEEEAELRALTSTSNEAEKAYEAFRPFSPDFRARVAAAIGPLGSAEPAPAPPLARAEEPRRNREHERPRRSRFLGWRAGLTGSGLAAAAAALFLVLRPPAALPAYALARVVPDVETTRSGEPEDPIPALTAGAGFTVIAHPETPLAGRARLGSQCFVVPSGDGRIRRLAKCAVEKQGKKGSLEIIGTIDPDLPVGPATLWIVVGYARRLPSSERVARLSPAAATTTRFWVALPKSIEIRAP